MAVRCILLFIFLSLTTGLNAQTNPAAHNLNASDYNFQGFATGTDTTYPAAMQGWKFNSEPTSTTVGNANGDQTLVVSTGGNATGSIRNEIGNGLSILGSGSATLGAIAVALNTTGTQDIKISWSAEDFLSTVSTRTSGLRLQYRIGTSGDFAEIPNTIYESNPSGNKALENFIDIPLPAAAENQPVVQLRWLYYNINGGGARDRIRLDNIHISAGVNSSCFAEDFATIISGNNISTGGSSSQWTGNLNFPTVQNAYQAGGAVRIGKSDNQGFIESMTLNGVSGEITVKLMVKGWTTVEGKLKVSIDGQSQTLDYTAKMADPFEEISATFAGITAGSKLKIETTAKRAFIDNVEIICGEDSSSPKYFRSSTNGDWTNLSSWQTSENPGGPWTNAADYPKANALGVNIQNGHNITLDSGGIVITKTDVYGTLTVSDNNYSISGTTAASELKIKAGGRFMVNGSGVESGGNAFALVETDGVFAIQSFTSGNNFVNAYLKVGSASNKFKFENNSIFSWEGGVSNTLGSSGVSEYFQLVNAGDLVIFRLTNSFPNGEFGSATTNTFHAILENTGNKTMNFLGNGHKIFEGGLRGDGQLTLNYGTGSGSVIFGLDGNESVLGDSGELKLIVPNNKVQFKNATVPAAALVTIETSNPGEIITRAKGNLNIEGILDISKSRITNTDTSGGIVVKNGGTLRTAYEGTGGIYGGSAAIPSGTLTLETNSTIEYNGANQNITDLNYYHLKMTGTGVKTPNGSFTTVDTNGSVIIGGTTTVNYSSKNLAYTDPAANNTKFYMTGGRLILGTTGTQPGMQGEYYISGGVVEFANSQASRQNIRGSGGLTNHYYKEIEVTGSNVGNSTGNINLENGGKFSVLNGGVFEINLRSIKCKSTNQCEVLVENGAVFKTGNSKGFTGYAPAGIGTDDSAIHQNIQDSDITLEAGSLVEYISNNPQKVSVFTPGYQNLKISGTGPVIGLGESGGINILVNNLTTVASGGKLTVQSTTDNESSNVLTAKKGVNNTGGQLIFDNNAQLLQDADAVNTGNVLVKRNFNFSADRKQYNFISSPVSGQQIKTIYPNIATVLRYQEGANWFYNAGLGDYVPAKAYAVKEGSGSGATTVPAEMTGVPANGNQIFTLEYDTAPPYTGAPEPGYNLVGNPYPSNLDIEALYDDNTDRIEPTFRFWDSRGNIAYSQQGSNYSGDNYAKYNAVAGVGVGAGQKADGSTGDLRIPTRNVKVGTGILIRAKDDANGKDLIFKNDYRLTQQGPGFFGKPNSTQKDSYWLTLTTPGGMEIMTAVTYSAKCKNNFWLDDTETSSPSDDIYTFSQSKRLSIQGKKTFNPDGKIKLGISTYSTGYHYIAVYKKEGIFEAEQAIYLEDKKLNITWDFNDGPYRFLAKEGDYPGRFKIVYKNTPVNADSRLASNSIGLFKQNNQWIVNSTQDRIAEIEVFDLDGRPVLKKANINASEFKFDRPASKGIFIINIKTEKAEVVNKKFVN